MSIITNKSDGSVEVTHAGCVVKTYQQEERVMSDVYADVLYAVAYNVEKDTFDTVYVRACFELGADATAVVDATPAVLALFEAHKAVSEAEAKLNEAKKYRAHELAALKAPAPGRTIKVMKGRKVPVGTVGECVRVMQGDYGMRLQLPHVGRERRTGRRRLQLPKAMTV